MNVGACVSSPGSGGIDTKWRTSAAEVPIYRLFSQSSTHVILMFASSPSDNVMLFTNSLRAYDPADETGKVCFPVDGEPPLEAIPRNSTDLASANTLS